MKCWYGINKNRILIYNYLMMKSKEKCGSRKEKIHAGFLLVLNISSIEDKTLSHMLIEFNS